MFGRLCRAAAAHLPTSLQFELRRANFSRQIHRGTFASPELEAEEIGRYLHEGDWAIDVGANIGHYTCQMARCVGASGRVLAFEPVPASFALLTANVRASGLLNVSLINLALSERASVLRMTVPAYEHSRLANYYRAHLDPEGQLPVLCIPLDAIPIPRRVRLIKIDAEGHDLQVLMGMEALVRKDKPVLIVEGWKGTALASWLSERAYALHETAGSSNIVATPLP